LIVTMCAFVFYLEKNQVINI